MTQFGDYTGVEKLNLASKDLVASNIQKLKTLFPAVITEGRDQDGHLQEAIDFDKLRDLLSHTIADGPETYEFKWVGKRGAIAEAGKPTTQTLRPDLEESVDFDKSENVFITGDNLEVLKVLQESYLGKIDMIYIDPPYNTGKDFVYSDKFQMSEEELVDEMDLRDEDGLQRVGLTKNEKSSARYHSDWLNMMYPRLVLARNLLKDSGVIFISIDDNEQANLKAICDEIFGEENFQAENIVIVKTEGRRYGYFAKTHETILVYSKDYSRLELNEIVVEGAKFSYEDSEGGFNLTDLRNQNARAFNSTNRPNLRYPFYVDLNKIDHNGFMNVETKYFEGGTEVWAISVNNYDSVWRWGKEKANREKENLIARQGTDGVIRVYQKYRKSTQIAKTLWQGTKFISNKGTREVQALFEGNTYFDFPKPIGTIKQIIEIGMDEDSTILDFFAGSATTADAVMQLNAEDGGNRKYILCTLDEQVADKSAAKEAGYETIDQISRERIRRAAKKIQEEHPETVSKQDFGFRAYKLDTSNFKDVSQTPDSFSQESLFDSVSNIKDGRTDLDLLFQIMLTWGMELSLPIAKSQIDGTDIYNVADGALIACFADEISESVLRQIAKEEPLRAVFKDESFANSAAKINLGQIFKEESPNTKVKVV
ncbi:site-specific DNA-methyltransferase [Streptococcus hyovaginalis]|uniref:site-specific DNA-methyltransferase n=1 Tax=Streptococcus hyovaginalis TaxID=149015 RepID=UPI003B3A83F1